VTHAARRLRKVPARTLRWLFALAFLSPFYVSLVYSVKSKQEIAYTGLAFPTRIHLENFVNGLRMSNYLVALLNTVLATASGTLVLTIACGMAAYIITRKGGRFYAFALSLFLVTILIPFQALMFPLYLTLKEWSLVNTLPGFTLAKVGSQIGYSVLITAGFVKTIPISIEEATFIDGGGRYRTFWQIVLPLMKPIIITTVVINALSIWNDFSISVVLLQKKAVAVLSLMVYYFFGENVVELNLAFAVFTLSMVPIIVLYLVAQRYVVSGIMMGAVKA
jgi:raffinose/stachyose/melibiose transport system permease protein